MSAGPEERGTEPSPDAVDAAGEDALLAATVAGVLTGPATERDVGPGAPGAAQERGALALWDELGRLGLTAVGVPEELGGSGGTLRQALVVLRESGRFARAVPWAEATVAAHAFAAARTPLPDGLSTVAPAGPGLTVRPERGGAVLDGELPAVPWAAAADRLLLGLTGGAAGGGDRVVVVDREAYGVRPGANLADEPRDTVVLDRLHVGTGGAWGEGPAALLDGVGAGRLQALGALARAAQMCGALRTVLELCIVHTAGRHQFGKPLNAFQAVQQHMAELAGEVVAASGALELAVRGAAVAPERLDLAAAVAKGRVGEAAGAAARLAHQVHGAIGFTREYPLHAMTRRLWAWRDEWGDERHWYGVLGRAAAAEGPWTLLTSVP